MERPRAGKITFRGQDITGKDSHVTANLGIGQVAEGRQIFPSLSVQENLEVGALLPRARGKREAVDAGGVRAVSAARRAAPADRRHDVRRRAADARHRPLPDGPARARSCSTSRRWASRPWWCRRCFTTIRLLNEEKGITVLLVEQNVAASLKLAKHAYVLENGRIVMQGRGEDLLHDDRVRQAYLGL